MKKIILSIVILATIGLTTGYSQTDNKTAKTTQTSVSKTTFGVRGNCGMCKNTIEKAANSVEGVTNANWDKEKKIIMVAFDNSKTNVMAIQEAIAASGYDTEKVLGNLKAYSKLPGCCKYDHSMEMNQTVKTDEHKGHNH